MRVMRRLYGTGQEGEERWKAHMTKLHDPFTAVKQAAGRRTRLATLLSLNGRKGKAGAGCDAPALWRDGKLTQLEMYCQRDVEALKEIVLQNGNKGTGRRVDSSSVNTANDHNGNREQRSDTRRGEHGRGGKRRRSRKRKERKERERQRTGRHQSRARQQRRHTAADGRK